MNNLCCKGTLERPFAIVLDLLVMADGYSSGHYFPKEMLCTQRIDRGDRLVFLRRSEVKDKWIPLERVRLSSGRSPQRCSRSNSIFDILRHHEFVKMNDLDNSVESAIVASENDSSKTTTRLLATGFNGHSQISRDTTSDILSFIPICETSADDLRVLFAGWSQTLIVAQEGLLCLGHRQKETTDLFARKGKAWKSAIGDVNGVLLTLAASGEAHVVDHDKSQDGDSPPIGHIALAKNGRVALTFQQTPTAQLCHIMEYSSYERFLAWLKDPSGDGNYPDGHHMLPGRPKQLLANTGTFVLLMKGGEVYTWGDARYGSLGRPISGGTAQPADIPGAVEAVGGLRIGMVAVGGWMCAALSEDGALYLWGTPSPGSKVKINALSAEDGGDVALVEIPNSISGEPLDVLDVAVGDDHIAVVAEGNRLFVVGENANGQLGVKDAERLADWHEIVQPDQVKSVWCGPLSTFALVDVK